MRELRCPLSDTAVRVTLLRHVRIVERDDDFCPRTLGPNPLLAAIHRCPGCGYCASTAEFAPISEERTLTKLRRALAGVDPAAIRTIRERYECRARLGVALGEPSQSIADAYLKAAWSARITGEAPDHERACLRKAAQYFALALQARSVPRNRVPVLTYLLAALHRRLDMHDDAQAWLAKLDELSSADMPAWLETWCDRLAARINSNSSSNGGETRQQPRA